MSKFIQAVRGMNDCLPEQSPHWQYVEAVLRAVVTEYGYQELRTPVVESTDLFKRSIGEVTDIVEKEMYTFDDRNGDSLTLRPEGTASCVRAGNQHGLLYNQQRRLWYMGPMFRHERPQKGRYRQFHQIGVETFGFDGPDIDTELLLMGQDLWQRLGVSDQITLEINSLGSSESRAAYKRALVDFLQPKRAQLDDDSLRRLETNPLRILDSKVPQTQSLLADAPSLQAFFDEESRAHFDALTEQLDCLGISYRLNQRLVRGLDYYNRTVFEWTTTRLGAQATVCAGGRYDGLVEQLGGKPAPACGFAIGLERLLLLLETLDLLPNTRQADIYVTNTLTSNHGRAIAISHRLRASLPGLKIVQHCGGGNLKKQLKKADVQGAKVAILVGDAELASGQFGVKVMDGSLPQSSLTEQALISFCKQLF